VHGAGPGIQAFDPRPFHVLFQANRMLLALRAGISDHLAGRGGERPTFFLELGGYPRVLLARDAAARRVRCSGSGAGSARRSGRGGKEK